MRRKQWLIPGIAVLALLGLGIAIFLSPRFQKWYDPPILLLPSDGDVVEMRASLRDFRGISQAIPEFSVPAEHVPVILDWLRPAEYNRDPLRLDRIDELGEIVIRIRSGEQVRLAFYWTGKGPAVFTRDGVNQFYGKWLDNDNRAIDGGMTLSNEIRQAWKARKPTSLGAD